MNNEIVEILEDFITKKNTDTQEDIVNNNNTNEPLYGEWIDPNYVAMQEKANAYDELYDKYLRQMAEYENYRKRTIKEKDELLKNGHQKAVETFLPLLDDMERALANIPIENREGVQLIYDKFASTFTSLNVKPIEVTPMISTFDANLHEAISMREVDDETLHNKVLLCVQNGYMLNDKVMRHAKVVVGNFKN